MRLHPNGGIRLGMLLGIINTVLVLGALGVLVYTHLIYKRPPITETSERERLSHVQKTHEGQGNPGVIQLDPFTVNIRSQAMPALPAEGTTAKLQGKLHFARVTIALELKDIGEKYKIDEVRPIIMDRLLTLLGNKNFNEVTTVQGRYILRGDILEMINQLVKEPLVTNVFFPEFIVQ